MNDVSTVNVSTGEVTTRAYDDIELAERAQWEKEQPALTFEEIRRIRNQLLAETDWLVVKAQEAGEAVPDAIKSYRTELRDLPGTLDDTSVLNFNFETGWPTTPEGV